METSNELQWLSVATMSDQLDTGRCYHAVIYPWISTSWTLIACHRASHLRSPSLIHPKSISQLLDFVWIRFSRCFLAIKMLVNKHVTDQLFGRIPWPPRCTLEMDPTVLNSNLSLTRKKISLDKTQDNTPLHPLLKSSHCLLVSRILSRDVEQITLIKWLCLYPCSIIELIKSPILIFSCT